MAKASIRFVCQNCGADYPKWMGRCSDCGMEYYRRRADKQFPGKASALG